MNPFTAVPMVGTAAYLGADAYMEGRGMIGPTQRYANFLKYDQNMYFYISLCIYFIF